MALNGYRDLNVRSSAPSIAEVVRRIITSRPILLDFICMDVVNYSALARKIREEVSSLLGKNVSVDAIKMALIRFAEKACPNREEMISKVKRVIERSSIELKSDIAVVTIRKEAVLINIDGIARLAARARFFQMAQGLRSFTIALSKEDLPDLIALVGKESVEDLQLNQVALLIVSPTEIISTPGVIAYITNLMAFNGINITHIVSCYRDTIIVVKREDALRAYEVIERALKSLSESSLS